MRLKVKLFNRGTKTEDKYTYRYEVRGPRRVPSLDLYLKTGTIHSSSGWAFFSPHKAKNYISSKFTSDSRDPNGTGTVSLLVYAVSPR
jgi:hypothetical protein